MKTVTVHVVCDVAGCDAATDVPARLMSEALALLRDLGWLVGLDRVVCPVDVARGHRP